MPVGLHENRRHAAGDSFELLHMGGVYAKLLEILNGRRTEQIVTHPGDHENVGPTQPGGHSLIRPLASKPEIELLAKNCLPGLGKAIAKSCQIDIRAANHRDARTFRHKIAESSQRSRLLSTKAIYHRVTETQSYRDAKKNKKILSVALCLCGREGFCSFPVGHPDVLHLRGVLQKPSAFALLHVEPVDCTAFVREDLLQVSGGE